LENFERNQVWELVDPAPGCKPIGTKWVWKNKEEEKGEVVRNKSKLVAQGFMLKEGIDYEETFAPIARFKGSWRRRRIGYFYPFPWLKGSSCTKWM
jgi:hypothetical protein